MSYEDFDPELQPLIEEHSAKIAAITELAAAMVREATSEEPARVVSWGNGIRYHLEGWFCEVLADPQGELTAHFVRGDGEIESTYPFLSEPALEALDFLPLESIVRPDPAE